MCVSVFLHVCVSVSFSVCICVCLCALCAPFNACDLLSMSVCVWHFESWVKKHVFFFLLVDVRFTRVVSNFNTEIKLPTLICQNIGTNRYRIIQILTHAKTHTNTSLQTHAQTDINWQTITILRGHSKK